MKRRAGVILINSLSSYARMGIGMLLSLLITSSTLRVLSEQTASAKEVFGIYMLLASITTACQFLNDSTNQAMVRFLSISLHEGDREKTQQFLNSGWVMSTGIGSAIALGMAVAAPWLVSSFNVPAALVGPAQMVVWLSAIAQVLAATVQPWYAVLSAQDRYMLINVLNVLQQFLTFVGVNCLHLLPFDPLVNLSLVWLLPGVVTGLSVAFWLWLQKPLLRLNFRHIQRDSFKQLFSLGGWSSLISIATNLYERTDQVLINLLLGPTFNTFYAVAVQMGSAINRLVTALTAVLLPTASRISSSGSRQEKQQLILRSTRYVLTLALPGTVAVCIFRREIIELWLGKGFDEAIAILPLTMFLVFSRIPILVTWPYLTAANQLKWPSLAMLFDGLVNVVLSVWYVKAFNMGLAGIVLGTLSTNLVRFTFFQIPFVARLVELPVAQYWKKSYIRPTIGMVWFTPAVWFVQQLQQPVAVTLALLSVVASLYTVWIWVWVFDDYERKLFLDLLYQLLKKKKAQNS